ncbi:MAG: DUF4145 domain-containing protein [Alphaproteobacteria bacterium]|nr:MAG: DUF4145 domain-containing protein [Alphaproteobacteria bacterium]
MAIITPLAPKEIVAHRRTCPQPECQTAVWSTGFEVAVGGIYIKTLHCPACLQDTVLIAPVLRKETVTAPQVMSGVPIRTSVARGVALVPGDYTQAKPPAKRGSRVFLGCPPEIREPYEAATRLAEIYLPAAGAMARRALEILLEARGYGSKNLGDSLSALARETDADRRVSTRLLARLGALREFGNFGLHVIRSKSTSEIVDVEPGEVELCLLIVEELVSEIYDRPILEAQHMAPVVAKLRDAGKNKVADALEASLLPVDYQPEP